MKSRTRNAMGISLSKRGLMAFASNPKLTGRPCHGVEFRSDEYVRPLDRFQGNRLCAVSTGTFPPIPGLLRMNLSCRFPASELEFTS